MLLHVPDVLTPGQVAEARKILDSAPWKDGRATAGHQSTRVKNNQQIPEDHPATRPLEEMILGALTRSPLFVSAALPNRVMPPLFNRYENSQSYGTHIDNAVRQIPGTPVRLRTDLSATLFLSAPEEYDGGELSVEDTYGLHDVKLPAGHLILYPASSLHRVKPVTRGARVAAFFWVQSMVRDDGKRALLLDLDLAIQRLNLDQPGHPSAVQFTGVYHNLLRQWAEV
ncbi:MAG TPA: Fe2+-dependent dioxygenase [Elusimicrobiota bacterium]|jgi:PKHD-type hydroxylase|nr:Fe2+-dependent dioxygenase [Elusimicrobiota bacterium]